MLLTLMMRNWMLMLSTGGMLLAMRTAVHPPKRLLQPPLRTTQQLAGAEAGKAALPV
jgi:hypothetical protein